MATDMAEDGTKATPDKPPHAAKQADAPKTVIEPIAEPTVRPSSPPAPETGEAEPQLRPGRPGSEWTASDDRGPLGRAEEEAEAEARGARGIGRDSDQEGGKDIGARTVGGHETASSLPKRHGPTGAPDIAAMLPHMPGEPIPPVDAIAAATATGAGSGAPGEATASTGRLHTTTGPEARRASLWPVAASVIIGALIGAGSAAFIYRGNADDSQADPRLASLQARLDALEKRPDPQPTINGLKSSVTALDNQVAGLRRGAGRTEPSAAPEAGAASPPPAQVDLGPVNEKIAALQSRIDAQKSGGADTKALETKVATLESALAGMKSATQSATSGVSSLEGRQKEMVGQQKALADKVMMPALAVVADSLVQQIGRGQPYAAQVDALTALGADPAKVATLRQNAANGVPSANALAQKFEPLALPITTTANKPPPNAGLVDRLKSGMFSMVSIRRADDTSGNDLASRVARIRAALAHDDVAGALEAWNALPADAKAKADAWAALAKTHVDAMTAARALQRDAIAALATSKS